MVDLSGYSYDLQPGASLRVRRAENPQWQGFAQAQLATGGTAVVVRFRTTAGLSRKTRGAIARWPLVAVVDGYALRHPVQAAVSR